ncbi:MAG: hypothetical protein M3065_19420 [Actinomycetota bacterium]|nr:hypothetical protein [Actinomycetota bacterium]
MTDARSTLDELTGLADEIASALSDVLDHSEIYEAIRNTPDSPAFIFGNPFAWRPVSREHQPLIGKARRLLETWEALTSVAVRSVAPSRLEAFRDHAEILREVVDQCAGDRVPSDSVVGVRNMLAQALQQQREMLADLPSAHGAAELLIVPDTNALVFQPALEEWRPTDGKWTVVLVPQVIRELDELKLRDKPVSEAANSFIRRLDEYGRRGDTFEGISVRPGVRLREVPIEADMTQAPAWLRPVTGTTSYWHPPWN